MPEWVGGLRSSGGQHVVWLGAGAMSAARIIMQRRQAAGPLLLRLVHASLCSVSLDHEPRSGQTERAQDAHARLGVHGFRTAGREQQHEASRTQITSFPTWATHALRLKPCSDKVVQLLLPGPRASAARSAISPSSTQPPLRRVAKLRCRRGRAPPPLHPRCAAPAHTRPPHSHPPGPRRAGPAASAP